MKILKGCVVLFFAWMACLLTLLGPMIVMHASNSLNEIRDITKLDKYQGYVLTKQSTDLFGNWITVQKGTSEINLKCDDMIFNQLSVLDSLGN